MNTHRPILFGVSIIVVATNLFPIPNAFGNACVPIVESSNPGFEGTQATDVFDGDLGTQFINFDDWQSITIDLGCPRRLTGFRRYMAIGGNLATRGEHGEIVRVSQDGQTWTALTKGNTYGWDSYPTELGSWYSVDYGWSEPSSPS